MEESFEKVQIVTWSSPDQVGLLSKITSIIAKHGGNLLEVIQYTDTDEQWFFLRAEIDLGKLEYSKIVMINKSLKKYLG